MPTPLGTDATTSLLGYQSQPTDPTTGLVQMGARAYNPTLGQFTTQDSYGGSTSDPLTLNQYIYAGDSPIINTDPTGHQVCADQSCRYGIAQGTSSASRNHNNRMDQLIGQSLMLDAVYQALAPIIALAAPTVKVQVRPIVGLVNGFHYYPTHPSDSFGIGKWCSLANVGRGANIYYCNTAPHAAGNINTWDVVRTLGAPLLAVPLMMGGGEVASGGGGVGYAFTRVAMWLGAGSGAAGATAAAASAEDTLSDPSLVQGLTPERVDELAQEAGYEVAPGSASAANAATRYYVPGTNNSVGFRVLPDGVAGQEGVKGGAYLRYFGGVNNGVRVPLAGNPELP